MQSQIAIPLFKRRGIFIDREQGGGSTICINNTYGYMYIIIIIILKYRL